MPGSPASPRARSPVFAMGALTVGVILLSVLVTYWVGILALQSSRNVSSFRAILQALEDLTSSLKDAETGQRGYLLTGDEAYLGPYREALTRIGAEQSALRLWASAGDLPSATVESVIARTAEKLAELDRTIQLRREGRSEAALEWVRAGHGKVVMDRIRSDVRPMTLRLERQIEYELERSRGMVHLRTVTFIVMGVFCVLVLVWAFRRLALEIRKREAQKELLRTTLASIGDGVIVTDAEGRISFLNAEAERLTKWTSADAAGRPLPEVFRIIHERTRVPSENPVDKVLRLGTIVGLANHTLLIAKDGTELPIDDSGAPVRNPGGPLSGIVLVFRDATEQRQAEQVRARLATIVETSGDVILSKTLDGTILTWNAAAERMFGYRAEEIVGKSVRMLIPPERQSEEDEILAQIRQGQRVERLETERMAKDGRRIPVSLRISPIQDDEGRVIGASKILHDVSDVKAAREALQREKELLKTTLASIGDGVIVTDAEGRVSFLNREAERLTGWGSADARGQALPAVFRILNEGTREPVENPVDKVLRLGTVVGLANHTVLVGKDGRETPIDDSAAPIRAPGGPLFGVVLVFRDFTEQKKAQAAVAEYARMLDTGFDAVIFRDPEDRIVRWNRAATAMYGWTEAEALGRVTHDLFKTKFPKPRADILADLRRDGRWEGELIHTRKDGRQMTVLSRWVVDREHASILEMEMDISDRKSVEEGLRRSKETLAAIFRTLPIGVALTKFPEGGFLEMNEAFIEMTGYSRDELVGRKSLELGLTRDSAARQRVIDRLKSDGSVHNVDLQVFPKEGAPRDTVLNSEILELQGEKYILSSLVDVTERKRHQEEIQRLNAALEARVAQRTSQLQESVQELETFSYTVAHDLRGPLRAMHRSAEVVLMEQAAALTEEGRGFLRRIAESANRMDTLIQDLLAYSRITRAELKTVPVEPRGVLADLLVHLAPEIQERKADVEVEAPLPKLLADPILLSQVFNNLISNALKFVPEGQSPHVKIRAQRRNGMERIWVEDNGIGIDPRFRERLFRIFERLDSDYPGTGIGLAIVRRAVERMGGTVGFESRDRESGSRFWIELPPADRS